MKSALKLFSVSLCFCISSGIAFAQSAPCSADSSAAQASPIGCVTGEGVQVSTTSVPEKTPESQSLTPEQRPALPPVVIFAGGKLTVTAKNSTLADILHAVASKTGAVIDIPEGAEERVVTQLGPAPARDVMAALLNGSHYNYVMVGTEADSEAIAHIILTAKAEHADAGTSTVASAGRPMAQRAALQAAAMQPYQEMLQQQRAAQEQQAQEMLQQQAAISESITPEPTAQATGDSGATANAGAAPAASAALADAATPDAPPAAEPARNGGPQGDRTPQQVLQDLYETRRTMMQQQHQPPPPAQQ